MPNTDSGAEKAQDERPVLLAVDDHPDDRRRIADELQRRYGTDYRIFCDTSSTEAKARLEELRRNGDEVAVVLADLWLLGGPDDTGPRLLSCVPFQASKKRFTMSTGRAALTATAFEMLPSIRRFQPVKPRDPRIITSHSPLVAVSRMASVTSP